MQQSINNEFAFTFIDLFAGIGGLRLAFENDDVKGKCVFTSENNPFAVKTYKANFPDSDVHGDITDIKAEDIPDHDVLLAGFPCQPFSHAGKKQGFAHPTQGTLFDDILRIIQKKKPHVFVLENVKGLQSHDKGNTYRIILDELRKAGYYTQTEILDAQYYVPQHRERTVIVGFKRQNIPFNLDKRDYISNKKPILKDILLSETEVDDKYILSDHLWDYLKKRTLDHKAKGNGFEHGLVKSDGIARTLSARYHKDGSEILIFRGENNNPRRLSPRECARLMGFKDSFQMPVSNTQAYIQLGNAVVVPLFKDLAKNLKLYIEGCINDIPLDEFPVREGYQAELTSELTQK